MVDKNSNLRWFITPSSARPSIAVLFISVIIMANAAVLFIEGFLSGSITTVTYYVIIGTPVVCIGVAIIDGRPIGPLTGVIFWGIITVQAISGGNGLAISRALIGLFITIVVSVAHIDYFMIDE